MSPIDKLKAEAIALRAKEKAAGRPMTHCAALEQIAKSHGYKNWRACCALVVGTAPPAEKIDAASAAFRRYESREWGFSLDIPKNWNAFPPISGNSRYEVIRFASDENGVQILIIFREPLNPKQTLQKRAELAQMELAKRGFGNFQNSKTALRSRPAAILNFDKPQGEGVWSCREYFVAESRLCYVLGFGTDQNSVTFDLYDRIAKTFTILAD